MAKQPLPNIGSYDSTGKFNSETAKIAQTKSVIARRERSVKRQELQDTIRAMLATPLVADTPVVAVEDLRSIADFKSANTDVMTRIILQLGAKASTGDLRAIDLIFRYGGLEPIQETEIKVDVPKIVNDIPNPYTQPGEYVDVTYTVSGNDDDKKDDNESPTVPILDDIPVPDENNNPVEEDQEEIEESKEVAEKAVKETYELLENDTPIQEPKVKEKFVPTEDKDITDDIQFDTVATIQNSNKRKRGRPKIKTDSPEITITTEGVKRKRGRPKKNAEP